jgi:hypothetical protein
MGITGVVIEEACEGLANNDVVEGVTEEYWYLAREQRPLGE